MGLTTRIARLHRAQETRPLRPGFPVRVSRSLARSERGNVTLLYVFFFFVLYCSVALVWNTGRASTAAVHAQTAADTAAYTGALWTSRALNMVTATNMAILKNLGAQIIHNTLGFAIALALAVCLIKIAIMVGRIAASAGADADAWTRLGLLLTELILILLWAASASPGLAINPMQFRNNIRDLKGVQDAFVRDLDRVAVRPQLGLLEQETGCKVYVTTPGLPGQVKPPLKPGSFASLAPMVLYRMQFKDDNWASYEPIHGSGVGLFASTPLSYTKRFYQGFLRLFQLVYTTAYRRQHHVLITSAGPVEWSPPFWRHPLNYNPHEAWKPFSVVAVASVEGASQQMVARGLFSSPMAPADKVLAYAEAETYNGVEQLMGKPSPLTARAPYSIPIPFRVWSSMGWQWQPRLTRGVHLGDAIWSDPRMKRLFTENAGAWRGPIHAIRPLH